MKTVLAVTFNGNLHVIPFNSECHLSDIVAVTALQTVLDVNDEFGNNEWRDCEYTIKDVTENGQYFFDYVEVESNDVVTKILECYSEHDPFNSDDAVFQHSTTTLAILRKFSLRSKTIEQ